MANDIILNKMATVERCLNRIKEEYVGFENAISYNFTKQDSIILNLLRAIEATVDIAMHKIRLCQLGLPQNSRDAFVLLEEAKIIPTDLSQKLQKMIGFRNIAVHDYTKVNLDIVKSIIETNLDDLIIFNKHILQKL